MGVPTIPGNNLFRLWPRGVFWIVPVFYAYGALVHVLNITSLTGFDWLEKRLKWQLLDSVYLLVDVVVVVCLISGSCVGIAAFFAAAISQIALHTVFRDWVLDVPFALKRLVEDLAYLDGLVPFHMVTCIAMAAAILTGRSVPTIGSDCDH